MRSYSGVKTLLPLPFCPHRKVDIRENSAYVFAHLRFLKHEFKVPKGTRNRPVQPGSSTVASFGRENDFCGVAEAEMAVCEQATLCGADDNSTPN